MPSSPDAPVTAPAGHAPAADRGVPNRVLVTGAAGLLGRHVLAHFDRLGIVVTALVLDDPGDLAADRVVVGDATDPDIAARAVADADAVVHLAALPSPHVGTPHQVFCGNTAATFTVLHAAGEAGIRRAAIASSINATGLPYHPAPLLSVHPQYLPFDEAAPTQAADWYALSKAVDEQTAAMIHRRYGMDVVALRFPFLATAAHLAEHAGRMAERPEYGARELWSYLDLRDAARACELGLYPRESGAVAAFVTAPDTCVPYPTEDLIAAFHPDVERRAGVKFPGRSVAFDLSVARRVLDFEARHLLTLEDRPFTPRA